MAEEVGAKLVGLLGKLLLETERLRRDVARLHGRVEPFENEPQFPLIPPDASTPERWSGDEVLKAIDLARRSILNSEYELTAIRGKMDAIESRAISREDMRPWIRPGALKE